MLQGCFKNVLRTFKGRFEGISRESQVQKVSQRSFKGVSGDVSRLEISKKCKKGCFKSFGHVSRLFNEVSRNFMFLSMFFDKC